VSNVTRAKDDAVIEDGCQDQGDPNPSVPASATQGQDEPLGVIRHDTSCTRPFSSHRVGS